MQPLLQPSGYFLGSPVGNGKKNTKKRKQDCCTEELKNGSFEPTNQERTI